MTTKMMNLQTKLKLSGLIFLSSCLYLTSCAQLPQNQNLSQKPIDNGLEAQFASTDWAFEPEQAESPFGENACSMGFEATVRSGPSAGTQIVGLLKFNVQSDGLLQNAEMFPAKGEKIPVSGQVKNGKVDLKFHLAGGGIVSGTGEIEAGRSVCAGTLKGPLTGPQVGDTGDWLGDTDGSAQVPLSILPRTFIYSVTATNQVFMLNTQTNVSTQIAGLSESATDTLLNGPTGVVYIEGGSTTAGRDDTHGLWISDTGNQRLVQYRYNATSRTWAKTGLQITRTNLPSNQISSFRPRGLTEYNRPLPGTIQERFLLIADEANHVLWAFTRPFANGFIGDSPVMQVYTGTLGQSLHDITDTTLAVNSNQALASLVFKPERNGALINRLAYGTIPVLNPLRSGFHHAPISLLPKRINRGFQTLTITSQNGCQQKLEFYRDLSATYQYDINSHQFNRVPLAIIPTPRPTPTPTPVSTGTCQFLCNFTGVQSPSQPTNVLRYEILRTGDNQPSNCQSIETAFARIDMPSAPSPSPTPSPTPTPTPTPVPTASPLPSESPFVEPSASPTISTSPIEQASLSVTPSELILKPGESVTLTANATYTGGKPARSVNWLAEGNVISLKSNGLQALVTAQELGRTEIRVDLEGEKLSVFVVVTVRDEKK